jgi:hypothetical protein
MKKVLVFLCVLHSRIDGREGGSIRRDCTADAKAAVCAERSWLEESSLGLCEFNECRALCIVIRDVVDASADRVAPHLSSIVGLQHLRYRLDIGHPRIEPQIITVWIKDNGHTVVDGRGDCVRCCCQDRTRLEPLPAGVPPSIPQSCERKQFPVIDFKTVWLFRFGRSLAE